MSFLLASIAIPVPIFPPISIAVPALPVLMIPVPVLAIPSVPVPISILFLRTVLRVLFLHVDADAYQNDLLQLLEVVAHACDLV